MRADRDVLGQSTTHKPLKVFISTLPKDLQDQALSTGDVDSANMLARLLGKRLDGDVEHLMGLSTEQDSYTYIAAQTADGQQPLLHIFINAPRTGFGFSLKGLENFKTQGGKLIITAVEFAKHSGRQNARALTQDTLSYLAIADEVLFLDENDKNSALVALKKGQFSDDLLFENKLQRAKLTAIPPSVTITKPARSERGDNILFFGMIRSGKGLAHVLKLASLIKQSDDEAVKNKKIVIIGSVQEHKTARDGTAYASELYKLMCALYPNKKAKLKDKSPKKLKELLRIYQAQALKPALPIVLHLDISEENLSPLFAQCRYAFIPA